MCAWPCLRCHAVTHECGHHTGRETKGPKREAALNEATQWKPEGQFMLSAVMTDKGALQAFLHDHTTRATNAFDTLATAHHSQQGLGQHTPGQDPGECAAKTP